MAACAGNLPFDLPERACVLCFCFILLKAPDDYAKRVSYLFLIVSSFCIFLKKLSTENPIQYKALPKVSRILLCIPYQAILLSVKGIMRVEREKHSCSYVWRT